MEQHPSYTELSALVPKYPRSAGALFQTYNDLKLAQQWTDLEVVDLTSCSRGALKGRRPKVEAVLCVIPCSLAESLSIAWLHDAFGELGSPPHIYLAINTEDSSIVYYKISPGIVKPPV
ncbi:tRNA intron endonuclease [Rhodofomes roseus]|uniref:tRNA intron endonuclease n=1 Tax=Rhodofomes roseus TaxID=34475 RepID=A0ABQ8KSQ5_9APHY|nr:tRNA intron endonuclease [Rhodofomes roseus]KAH9841486.1 tRNA intron endonuclease [Rhodofomes roseus]